jgi:SAM-dependent methyltransferase
MGVDVEAVDAGDWIELAAVLQQAGYTTEGFRAAVGAREPVEDILKNTGRYSYFYLDQLASLEGPFAVLARLFMLCGRVPAADLGRLGEGVAQLLHRTGLVVPVAEEPALVHATAAVTEVHGRLFLSDSLFENTGAGFVVHDTTGRCMPPHASSLELLGRLEAPGATSFLDVGCGSGCQSVLFAAGYERVLGFDMGARQVSFARANARLNGVEATYVADRWETFLPLEPFDHVAFNTPDAETAYGFINGCLDKALAPAGVAQVYLKAELTDGEGGWAQHVAGRLTRPGDWDVRIHVHSGSPFGLPAKYLAEGRLPAGTLLVDHPSKARDYVADLRRRRVTEVAGLTLTLARPSRHQA